MSFNFALSLFLLMLLTGFVWLLDLLYLRKIRQNKAMQAMADIQPSLLNVDEEQATSLRQQAYDKANTMPWWIEYAISFFPVILFVFVLRSFIIEPFRIPSGSMLPTLQSGDLILVNKYQYGIRLPIIDKKVINVSNPDYGDVVVFRYPVDTSIDYIKRVVGLPGDTVQYHNKVLSINGKIIEQVRDGDYFEPDRGGYIAKYSENIINKQHDILLNKRAGQNLMAISNYPYRDACEYSQAGVRCVVPQGHYFMMGDNRDNSLDSRYWGFVPDENIVGRAFLIWMNFKHLSRIGRFD